MSYQIKTSIMKTKVISLENIESIEILYYGNQLDTEIDLGSVTLQNGSREFIFDVCQSYRSYDEDEDKTLISVEVEVDKEVFPDCPYNLTERDLLSKSLSAEIFINSEELEQDPITKILCVKVGGEELIIDLNLEK